MIDLQSYLRDILRQYPYSATFTTAAIVELVNRANGIPYRDGQPLRDPQPWDTQGYSEIRAALVNLDYRFVIVKTPHGDLVQEWGLPRDGGPRHLQRFRVEQ